MRITIAYLVLLLSIGLLSYRQAAPDHSLLIDTRYIQQLDNLKKEIVNLQNALTKDLSAQKAAFKKCRLAYKKLSVLTDYFNPYETILLNNPALQRTEDDNPTTIIDPHGFQQLEALIWSDDASVASDSSKQFEANYILDIIAKLESEPDRLNKFTDGRIWESLRVALITITTKTIAGFDSPIAQYSIEEASAMLLGVEEIANIYEQSISPGNYQLIQNTISNAQSYLANAKDFNSFDRLYFIKNILNPLCGQFTEDALAFGDSTPERRPIRPTAANPFAKDFFDENFFSPNQRYQYTAERMLLGKKLFYDTQLSGSGTRSCATCHKPELAFTDGLPKAISVDNKTPLNRNTPTLLNAVFQTNQFYDSRQTMLEFQIGNVVHNASEMGGSIEKLAATIKQQKDYTTLFAGAYPSDKDPVNVYTIANAIASFLRSLQSMNARFDQYMRNEDVSFSSSEKNGFNLFVGKAKCATCHFIPLFNGLVPPQFNETESEVIGVPASNKKPARLDADSGKYYFTKSIVHLYAFKTPTLRNITLTAPYMHNGVFNTLQQVLDFYNDGGGKSLGIAPSNQTLPFDKLKLTKSEKKDIINFMSTLTDTTSYKNVPTK
jgi:cytochrome c peroxidase